MKNQSFALLLAAVLLSACNQLSYKDLEIEQSNLDQIRKLTLYLEEMGPRNAGTREEAKTAGIIAEELKKAGISVRMEEFSFDTYKIHHSSLTISGREFTPTLIGLNPYENIPGGKLELYVFDPERGDGAIPENSIVLSGNPDLFFYALQSSAAGFISISPDEFTDLKKHDLLDAVLDISGEPERRSSANLVADIGTNASPEAIYISAHYDSYLKSPGANDNGAGLSSAIELAKLLKSAEKSLALNVKFIFVAAEEIGLAGSRQYVSAHLAELGNCKCLINLDTFGGNEAPYIAAAPGINNAPREGYTDPTPEIMKNRALEGPGGAWRLFDPALFSIIISTNYPQWYQDIVNKSAAELGYEISTRQLMSDHLTFAAAGVPSISIQSRDHSIHSEDDIVENINFESVDKCISLTLQIIKDLMDSVRVTSS